MSTNSAIIAPCVGGFRGIYCHCDGYVKGGVGETLFRHYTDSEKIAQLLDLGDISSLGERVNPIGAHSYERPERGTTVAYHRDRGEELYAAEQASSVKEVDQAFDGPYSYFWDGTKWFCNGEELANKFN